MKVTLLLSFALCTPIQADVTKRGEKTKKTNDQMNVPEARDVSATFIAGETVEIELSAAVSSLKGVTFFVRQQPQHGMLSEIRPHPRDNNKAIVTYKHLDRGASLIDFFTYACRVDEGSFSAPATVRLTGKKFDPILEITRQPQFGRIFVGGETTSKVQVKNTGAAAYKQPLAWEPPWYGPAELEVLPGQSTEFLIAFRPLKSGNFSFEQPLQIDVSTSVIALFGDAIPALTASPSRLVLQWDPKTKERSAILTLANGRIDSVDATLALPDRLLGPKNITINPQSKAEVRLFLAATDVAALKSEVTLSAAGGIDEKVSVEAIAQPAEIKVVTPKDPLIDFRIVNRHDKEEREFVLENTGGQDLLANILARPPFSIDEAGQVIRLQPGQQRRFMVHINTKNAGVFDTTMDVSGASQKVVVRLLADIREVEPKPGMTTETPTPATVAAASEGMPEAPAPTSSVPAPPAPATKVVETTPVPKPPSTPIKPNPLPEPKLINNDSDKQEFTHKTYLATLASLGISFNKSSDVNPHLDVIKIFELKEATPSSLTLAWNKPAVTAAGWKIESSSEIHNPENGVITKIWLPISNVEPVLEEEERFTAKVTALDPASQYEFRVLAVDAEGKVSRPSYAILVTTAQPWRVPAWVWRLLILSALAMALYILYRYRRGDFEFEF